jgi:hypothetical protein
MIRTTLVAAALALSLGAGTALCARTDLGNNAALTYWRAFAIIPETAEEEAAIMRPDSEAAAKATPEQKQELAGRWAAAVGLMREAAAIPQCDWGIDYEKDGPITLMPHISKERATAFGALFRARYLWGQGQRKEAADDLRALVIMARHVGNEGARFGNCCAGATWHGNLRM